MAKPPAKRSSSFVLPDRGAYDVEVEREKTRRKVKELSSTGKFTKKELKLREQELGLKDFEGKTDRMRAFSGSLGTGLSLLRFFKPLLVFMLVVVLVLGFAWPAFQQLITGLGWWWLAIVFAVLAFLKFRRYG